MTEAKDAARGLTVARLRELLTYDPCTGAWKRLRSRGGEPAGASAGTLKSSGYILIDVDGHRYRSHRLAWLFMTGEWPVGQVDHINNSRSDNRWANLRLADNRENQANSRCSKNNRCGVKGVFWSKQRRKWQAKISPHRRQVHLGFFECIEDARAAYAAAAERFFGKYGRAG